MLRTTLTRLLHGQTPERFVGRLSAWPLHLDFLFVLFVDNLLCLYNHRLFWVDSYLWMVLLEDLGELAASLWVTDRLLVAYSCHRTNFRYLGAALSLMSG